MALSGLTITGIGNQGLGSTVRVESKTRVQFDLDGDYTAGGYAAFSTFLKTVLGTRVSIISVKQENFSGGYKLWWDRVNDTLIVAQGAAGLGPDSAVPAHTDLSAVTNVEMIVEWC